MIIFSIILALLAVFGAPLFTVIAASALIGFHGQDSDLMVVALEIQSIAGMPFLSATCSAKAMRPSDWFD